MKLHEFTKQDKQAGNKFVCEGGTTYVVDEYNGLVTEEGVEIEDIHSIFTLVNLDFTPAPQYTQLDIDMAKALKAEGYVKIVRWVWHVVAETGGGQEVSLPSFMFKPLEQGVKAYLDDIIGG